MKSWLVAIGTVLSIYVAAQKESDRQMDICVPESELSLNGVAIETPRKEVQQRFGEPVRFVHDGWGIDDGGRYTVFRMDYPAATIYFVRGGVDVFRTRSEEFATPRGVRVGLTLEEVADALGAETLIEQKAGVSRLTLRMQLGSDNRCFDIGPHLNIEFGADGKAAELQLQSDRP